MTPDEARREVEEMIWAFAERFGPDTLWSEDFEDGRLYGRLRARDPFAPRV